jgi:hypothetical protein
MKLNELDTLPELGNTIVLDGNVYVKKQEPLTREEISYGFRINVDAINAESFWAGVEYAENMHGITGVDDE